MKKSAFLSFLLLVTLILGACTQSAEKSPLAIDTSIKPTAVPTALAKPLPSGWQSYEDSRFGYKIGYPADYAVDHFDERRIEIAKKEGQPEIGTANFVFVWVFDYDVQYKTGSAADEDKQLVERLLSFKYGERRAVGGPVDWFTYTRDQDRMISGRNAATFYNTKVREMPPTTKEHLYIIPNGSETYVVGGYISTSGKEAFAITEAMMLSILETLSIPVSSK